MIINQTTVGNALKGFKCKPVNADATIGAVNSLAEDIVEKACLSAKLNGRKTIKPVDIRPFISKDLGQDDKRAAKSLKVANHVFDAKVKEYMADTPLCRIGGNRLKMSKLAGAFLDKAIEDVAERACNIGNKTISAKIVKNLI